MDLSTKIVKWAWSNEWVHELDYLLCSTSSFLVFVRSIMFLYWLGKVMHTYSFPNRVVSWHNSLCVAILCFSESTVLGSASYSQRAASYGGFSFKPHRPRRWTWGVWDTTHAHQQEKSESSSAVIERAQQEGVTTLGYSFEKPSAIQQRVVIPIISGRDVIA